MSELDRRTFLTRSALLLGAGGVGGAGAIVHAATKTEAAAATPTVPTKTQEWSVSQAQLAQREPFDGPHQTGILTPAPAQATFAALDSLAPDRKTLEEALRALSLRARELTDGTPTPLLEVDDPPVDSGILGPVNDPDVLTVTIAFGASLFDQRYGLASQRPRELIKMPTFSVDDLDPAQSHGDLLLQICAHQRDTVVHTLRELLRTVRGSFQLRWNIDGFSGAARGPSPHNSPRNLFAFRDGTANPPTGDPALMSKLVWAGDGEPAWAAGGTYQVARIIRQHVEFWDRVGLNEQENMIGRVRTSGAPLGGTSEFEEPRYDLDPHGKRIPLDAHIRLANPRTPATEDQRILRRGFNYTHGFDAAGQLDQGLMFVAFNQSPERQFATIQQRLSEEPMIDYITPVGGGYFFAPPGARGESDWVGSGLFAA
ncbi:MAG TPA: Dyp-type peroxidase [Solirubrobacteraceae bacterium]|jgi:deferrochelatase/peroxidase EfeB